ncbi:hypothetical protein [Achromobacter sp. 413638]|uniref:hypothetical protein n=1 Tax=Achromobacter sp. 413638 TaxID=3342385 RepID=UPI00370BC42D
MANPVPVSKAADAFRELIKRRQTGDGVGGIDEFTCARLERAAIESMDVDPVGSHQVLGAVAACRWDVEGVRVHFSQAMEKGGGYIAQANFARALYDVNRIGEAAAEIEMAAMGVPEQLAYLKQAIANRLIVGDWERAVVLLDVLALRTQDLDADMVRARKTIEFGRRLGLRHSTVGDCVGIALDLLAAERVRIVGVSDSMDDIVEDGAIYFDIVVHATADVAESLDDRLTPLLFDGVQDMQLNFFGLAIKSEEAVHGTH